MNYEYDFSNIMQLPLKRFYCATTDPDGKKRVLYDMDHDLSKSKPIFFSPVTWKTPDHSARVTFKTHQMVHKL